MDILHYTTTDGTIQGRASAYFLSSKSAETLCKTQNNKAAALVIRSRYDVATISSTDPIISSSEIRE